MLAAKPLGHNANELVATVGNTMQRVRICAGLTRLLTARGFEQRLPPEQMLQAAVPKLYQNPIQL
jgi:hypothetical protein